MKVLLLAGADHKYGTPRMTINMIRSMREINADIEYVVLTQTYGIVNELCNQIGVENYVIPYRYCVYAAHKNIVLNFVKKHMKRMVVNISMICALVKLNRFVNMKEIDLIHTNLERDLFGAYIADKYQKPHIVHLREFLKDDFNLSLLFPNQIRYMNMHTNYYIAISEAVREKWIKFGLDIKKIRVIYDGTDVTSVLYEQKEQENDSIHLVMCGQIIEAKGQMQLVKAINLLKQEYCGRIYVDLYGEGVGKEHYYEDIKKYVHDNHLENMIHLLGYQKDVTQKLYRYDIGFNCSRSEGFGLVTVEYMLAGVCPIVSNSGANKELIVDRETGLVYEFENILDLSLKIRTLIEDKTLRITLAQNARKKAESFFSIIRYAEEINKLYNVAFSDLR